MNKESFPFLRHSFLEYDFSKKEKVFWFRILWGYGLIVKSKNNSLLFSERTGHIKYITLLGLRISVLKKR